MDLESEEGMEGMAEKSGFRVMEERSWEDRRF